MASSLGLAKVNAMVLMCIVVVTPFLAIESAITCNQVVSYLTPCIDYLRNGGAVPTSCCTGVQTLNTTAETTPDRQAACNCMKTEAGTIQGLNVNFASTLPGKCGVDIPYPIDPSFDCTLVH